MAELGKNRKLGQVMLDDLPHGPAGSVRVELVITVDVESILGVTARELKTGKEASVTIRPSGGLSQREIVEIINRPPPRSTRSRVRLHKRASSAPSCACRLASNPSARPTTTIRHDRAGSRAAARGGPASEVEMTAERVDPAVLKVADAVGALIESWGFKRNMGRMWTVLYLEDRPLTAGDLQDRLGLSTGAVSMLLAELVRSGIVQKGRGSSVSAAREHYEAETSLWKMVSRVFRERELNWIKTAVDAFAAAGEELEPGRDAATQADRRACRERLARLAQVGAKLLESILDGESVDSLPIKTMGELARRL